MLAKKHLIMSDIGVMALEGYKLRYKLITFLSSGNIKDISSVHAKTFDIALFISPSRRSFVPFDRIEAIISETLEVYSEKNLVQVPPFDNLEPTITNLGNVFFVLLKEALFQKDLVLETLEISESPIRSYIVNEVNADRGFLVGHKKIKATSLLMDDIISQSTYHLLSENEKEGQTPIPVVHAPAPVAEAGLPLPPPKPKIEDSSPTLQPVKVPVYQFTLCFLLLTVCGVLITIYLKKTGAYPSGSDIYGHLFKSDFLYHSIRAGDFYPLYTDLWYNGMQPFRYWAPLPYYFLVILQFIAGGDAISSYLLFVLFAFVIGGTGWLLWGWAYNRMLFTTFLGVLWFFLPDNIRVFFVEGNFPRMAIAIFLPYLFYFVWRYVEHSKTWAVVPVIFIMCCIILSHVMIAAMTGIGTFIFLFIYSMRQKRLLESFQIIVAMLLSFALCGVWLYPALQGGLMGMNAAATSEVMQSLSTPISISLNPLLRTQEIFDYYYFGLSILVISIIGIFVADKKRLPGFLTSIIIFLGTTTVVVPFLEKLPLNQLLWMMRFTPIVYAIFMLALLEWRNCRRYVAIIIAFFLIIDSIPSAHLEKYFSHNPARLSDSLSTTKELTRQRVSLIDLSVFDSYPSYYFSSKEPKTKYTFGWAWQGAATANNIMMINTAAEKGYYYYLFDRSLELGDDTVMVHKELVDKAKRTMTSLLEAAQASGYKFYKETNFTYIFHRDTPACFGVASEYAGLAIGNSAKAIALEYPSFEEGSSDNLTDYRYEDLSRYKVIYLSGFSYNDKKAAEELLTRTANGGVRIIIDMGRIPVDPVTSRMTLFGVTAQAISFSAQYPELMYHDQVYQALPFKEEYSTWNTFYLDNVEQAIGYSWFKNKNMPFLGTAGSPNIIFMGYNILFHAMETQDESIIMLINDLLEFEPTQLPDREVVSISVKKQKDKLIIDSEKGSINTTIAYQDNFRSDQKIYEKNNLLVVQEPHTEIEITYAYLAQGLALSGAGVLGTGVLLYFIIRKRRCVQ